MEMEDAVIEYFSSISYLSKKVFDECYSIKKKYGDAWCHLSAEKQEELLDEYFIDQKLVNHYSSVTSHSETLPNCFPVLKINSGEKIIVDFEHDEHGWTWKDEHSGPFSWRTKSQQDLTLDDLKIAEVPSIGVKRKAPAKTHSVKGGPDVEITTDAKNEVEEMFKKFGLKKSKEDATGKFVDQSNFGPENLGFVDTENEIEKESSGVATANISPSHLYCEKSKLLEDNQDCLSKTKDVLKNSKKKALITIKKKPNNPPEISKENISSATNVTMKNIKQESITFINDKLGNHNQVFVHFGDVGETSTDDFLSQPEPFNSSDKNSSFETSTAIKKTGFDFLDDW